MTVRVGQSIDTHRFSDDPARPLVLGGVTIDGSPGLVGHSDADVVAHACAEALLGSAAMGDLGSHFPDDDPRWADADSIGLLAEVVRMISDEGWTPVNVDCTVIAEQPKLAPHREAMQKRLSSAVGAPVHMKATTSEQMGALGRGEGIACLAVALVEST